MNLHGIVANVIAAVNPLQTATIKVSLGAATSADGTRVPAYAQPVAVSVQVQDISTKDLQQIAGLNIQGETKAIYLNGDWEGIVRPDQRGGDLITINGTNWLVVSVTENWPDWTKVIACRQL